MLIGVDELNNSISPVQDEYIERFLNEAAEGKPTILIKSTIHISYIAHALKKLIQDNIIFSPEF